MIESLNILCRAMPNEFRFFVEGKKAAIVNIAGVAIGTANPSRRQLDLMGAALQHVIEDKLKWYWTMERKREGHGYGATVQGLYRSSNEHPALALLDAFAEVVVNAEVPA